MRSKSSFKQITNLLVKFPHFTKKNVKDKPEKWETFFAAIFLKSKIGNKVWPPKSSMGTLFQPGIPKNGTFFWVWGRNFCDGGAPATSLNSATLWGLCCLKTTLVVFVAKNCWFYQNLEKIGTTNENWIVGRWGGTNLLPICCHMVSPLICCQFLILLKS